MGQNYLHPDLVDPRVVGGIGCASVIRVCGKLQGTVEEVLQGRGAEQLPPIPHQQKTAVALQRRTGCG